ncbi:hypothetical protein [uncultured Gammaproteobacteria bacterium]|nr:hypothetical protein [uncultured Gammaproteobacteria bacterium]CAC9503644.1 hypothetical protein [uncultured Gammaproteobacteria bacterium]CAC9995586.1 hypothetical protein [uncultured Gammaproteobacteria bacterium]
MLKTYYFTIFISFIFENGITFTAIMFFLKLKYHDYFCQFSWQVVFDSVLDEIFWFFAVLVLLYCQ